MRRVPTQQDQELQCETIEEGTLWLWLIGSRFKLTETYWLGKWAFSSSLYISTVCSEAQSCPTLSLPGPVSRVRLTHPLPLNPWAVCQESDSATFFCWDLELCVKSQTQLPSSAESLSRVSRARLSHLFLLSPWAVCQEPDSATFFCWVPELYKCEPDSVILILSLPGVYISKSQTQPVCAESQ